jgi:DnaJ-domain-containing protein 1
MASLYHPDKVAHLAPEFREMADQKMKEINTAYGSIKGNA